MGVEGFLIAMAFSVLSSFWSTAIDTQAVPQGPPPYIEFSKEAASWKGNYGIDVSHTSDGVVSLSCSSDVPLRLIVEKHGEMTYYAIPTDGTPFSIPLSKGTGIYMFSIMEHVEGTAYRTGWKIPVEADMKDPFAPYKHASLYVPYEESDACIAKAKELRESAPTTGTFLQNVELFVEDNVEYDYGYVPGVLADHVIDPDATLASGRGICLDQAALVTAMLRSQGVPAKLIFGDVIYDNKSQYHAWTLAWDGHSWVLLDACWPEEYQNAAVYETSQWF